MNARKSHLFPVAVHGIVLTGVMVPDQSGIVDIWGPEVFWSS